MHYVRAEVECSGFLIEPAGDNECLVTYLNQADLRGRLPRRLLEKVLGRRVDLLMGLRRYMANVH